MGYMGDDWDYNGDNGSSGMTPEEIENRQRQIHEDMLRREELIRQPGLQIVPTEQEERPYRPTPDDLQDIIDNLDEEPAAPQPQTPWLN